MTRKPLFYYGWIILAISFIAMALAHGARNSFSVFYVVILDEFGWSRAGTAGIFSINVVLYGIIAPLAGAWVDKFGPRKVLLAGGIVLALVMVLCSRVSTIYHFYLLFGIAGGIGTSLIAYPTNAAVLPHWFVRRRGMAFGILSSGWGASFLMVPLVQFLITKFGWRISFVLVGIFIGSVLLPLVFLFSRHKPQDMDLLPDGLHSSVKPIPNQTQRTVRGNKNWRDTNWTLKKVMGTYRFWLMFFSFFCIFGFVENLMVVHQIVLMRDAGFDNVLVASIVALWGIVVIIGSLSGLISDKIGREKAFTLACSTSILGLFMLLLAEKFFQVWILYLYAIFFGLGMGMSGPILGAATADIFQGENFGSINGFMILGFGLGGIIGPWFGGFVFDTMGSYFVVLITAILITCVTCMLLWIAAPRKIRKWHLLEAANHNS